jgi:SAM-dependent methyltransferase
VASSPSVPLYDDFVDYDRFIHWERRLAYELPFIEEQLAVRGARRVLDAACGTGKHTLALAQRGYEMTGADLSAEMIARAQKNARAQQNEAAAGGDEVHFVVAGFGELAAQVGPAITDPCPRAGRGPLADSGHGFDALLCLGNSLPHVLTLDGLRTTMADFGAVLRPGGLLFIQNRNLDAVLEKQDRWMPLQARQDGPPGQPGVNEWLFVRFYDLNADGTLTFHVITLEREGAGPWVQRRDETVLYPWRRDQLVAAVAEAGFDDIRCYGDMAGSPYDQARSGNLVLTAIRGGGDTEE